MGASTSTICAPPRRPTHTRSGAGAPRNTSPGSPTTAFATWRSPAIPDGRRSLRWKAESCMTPSHAPARLRVPRIWLTASTATWSGASATTTAACPPTAHSGTSGRGGSATGRKCREERCTSLTPPRCTPSGSATWKTRSGKTAACRTWRRRTGASTRAASPFPRRPSRSPGTSTTCTETGASCKTTTTACASGPI